MVESGCKTKLCQRCFPSRVGKVTQPQWILGGGGYQRQPVSLYDQMFMSSSFVSSNSLSSSTQPSDPMFFPAQEPGEFRPATRSQSGGKDF